MNRRKHFALELTKVAPGAGASRPHDDFDARRLGHGILGSRRVRRSIMTHEDPPSSHRSCHLFLRIDKLFRPLAV